jgi:hypothetical protein
MVSRKKAAGKARKAAKAEAKKGCMTPKEVTCILVDDLRSERSVNNDDAKCFHGFGKFPEGDNHVEFLIAFLEKYNTLANNIATHDGTLNAANKATREKYAAVWLNLDKMELMTSYFLSKGAESILDGHISAARFCASVAGFFEQWMSVMLRKIQSLANPAKLNELINSDERSLVTFFRKRIPCSCLDGKRKEVKSITKMGLCANRMCSLKEMERNKMLYCTRCRGAYYCSRDCQKADWARHKDQCEALVELQNIGETTVHESLGNSAVEFLATLT